MAAAMMMDGTSSNGVKNEVRQPIAIFAPSMWKDVLSTFSLDDQVQQKYSDEIEVLKKEARSMLLAATSTTLLILIDKLERLGLAYHFETEIENKLKEVYDSADEEEEETNYDLFTTALCFRLFRQHQYHVSCNVFAKFVDKDNKWKENLSDDVEGLLSLYEAAYVRIHDEKVLEEAVAFTTHHLNRMLPQLESPLKVKEVQHALQFPLQRIHTIIFLHSYIDNYENQNSRNEVLLRLAKLNFNFMQNVFRNELYQISTWWNELNNVPSKVPYFRDRLVENYMWCLAHHCEPHCPVIRLVMTKLYILITIMDDTYDNYCALSEIELLTRTIEGLNVEEIDLLPEYLKFVCKLIMSVVEEVEREAEKQGNSNIVPHFVDALKQLGRSYAKEQKWIMEKHMPSFEERMINSRVTTLKLILFSAIAALMESGAEETLDWVQSDPEILIASSDIVRLNDDICTHQRESNDGTLQTCMDYYMKDKGLSSVQEAELGFREMIEDGWKDLNAAWVECKQHPVPKEIAVQFVNIARMCAIIYMNGHDNFSYPEKKHYMTPTLTALFIDPTLV